jgi:hypothetical protein
MEIPLSIFFRLEFSSRSAKAFKKEEIFTFVSGLTTRGCASLFCDECGNESERKKIDKNGLSALFYRVGFGGRGAEICCRYLLPFEALRSELTLLHSNDKKNSSR